MASPKLDLTSLRNRLLAATDVPEWTAPEDLNRMSVEAMAADTVERTLPSTGSLRLSGDGVTGHSASMGLVGQIMTDWQKLVTAIGAAHEGSTSTRGRLPGKITSATRLMLSASPAPGSVVLNFVPEALPEDELHDERGTPLFGAADTQIVDGAVNEAMELLELAAELGPDLDESQFVGRVKALGSRTALALAEFARVTEAGSLNADLAWRQPGRATHRTTFTPAVARQLVEAVQSRELTKETLTIRGTIVTLSVQSNLVIKGSDGELYSIRRGSITPEVQKGFTVEDEVEVVSEVVYKQRPGDEPRPEYTAVSLMRPRTSV